jgi:hypothetical protein
MLTIQNHGPLITDTNFWGSEYDRAGKLYCSCKAGAIRVLLPQSKSDLVGEWRTAKYVILSRGPWPQAGLTEAVEILLEDGSDNPYALHLSPESFDLVPAEPEPGLEWVLSVWVLKNTKPHKALERPCKWRRSAKLPDLSAWKDN